MPATTPSTTPAPLVSIGIPTYNRAASLRRAVASALHQTHARVEVVIADNGSTDATPEASHDLAAADGRVRVLRQPVNRGPIANFNAVLADLRGDYAMLLADDDWLDLDYVERCLAELRAHRDHALVGGIPRYYDGDRAVREGQDLTLGEDDPAARVRRYLRQVDDNGIFYGLARRDVLQRAVPMPDVLGADWLLVSAVAFAGKVRMLGTTHVNRATGGTSRSIPHILTTIQTMGGLQARVPYVYTAATAFAQMAWASPAYASAGRTGRVRLALRAAPAAMRWKGSLWLLAGPALRALARRRRGRPLRPLYEWGERRGGAPVLPGPARPSDDP